MNIGGSNVSTYNAYLNFLSNVNQIKNRITIDYVKIKAVEVAKSLIQDLPNVLASSDSTIEIALKARQLSNKAYFECKQKLEQEYSDPVYKVNLNAYLQTIKGYCENSLNDDIKAKITKTLEKTDTETSRSNIPMIRV